MTDGREPTIRDRLKQRPSVEPKKISQVRPRDLGYRFLAGAITSVVAGAITLAFGARVGGVMLAFPAILGASLTLIEKEEGNIDAREDCRGATMGGLALGVFAAVAALTLGSLSGALALGIAAASWVLAAVAGYALLWWR